MKEVDAESRIPRDWLQKAQKDWRRVRRRLEEGDLEDAAFHLQQALEKFLKAYLLSKGWRLRRIHDLEVLLDEAVKYREDWEQYRLLCQKVTDYYLIGRYPFLPEVPPQQDIEAAFREAHDFVRAMQREFREV